MAYVVVKGTVRHNGKSFKVGEGIPGLKKDEAGRLIELGAVEEDKRTKLTKDDEQNNE